MIRTSFSAALLAFAAIGAARMPAADQAEGVVVALRPTADVAHSLVLLRDIAEVRTKSSELKSQIEALDVLVLEQEGDADMISSRQVRMRLLLEGIGGMQVTMTGSRESAVRWTNHESPQALLRVPSVDETLREAAVRQLADAWLVSPEDVEVQFLVQGLLGDGVAPGTYPDLEMPARLEPGRLAARIRWMNAGRLERVEQLTMEVRLRQTVLLAAASISRGETLEPAHFIEDRRLLSTRVESPPAEEAVGLAVRRSLTQGDVILKRDVLKGATGGPIVQPRDILKVTVRKGALTIVLQAAEALQSARMGDVIRLRNMQSNQVLTGTVISSQEAEIVLN